MRTWFARHPRIRLVGVIALSPLMLLDVARIVRLACRDAYATVREEISGLAREWADFFAELWREAFPPKEG